MKGKTHQLFPRFLSRTVSSEVRTIPHEELGLGGEVKDPEAKKCIAYKSLLFFGGGFIDFFFLFTPIISVYLETITAASTGKRDWIVEMMTT